MCTCLLLTQVKNKAKGLNLRYDANVTEIGYADGDLGGDPDKRRSTSEYTFVIAGGTVSWSSKKRFLSAISTQESEYIAVESDQEKLSG